MNKDDRRFKKTEKALAEALAELMKEKVISKITIDELVCRADLHRSTFYTHYQDIYDLYNTLKGNFFNKLKETATENIHHDYTTQYAAFIEYLIENKQLAILFLGEHADPDVSRQLGLFLKERILSISAFESQTADFPESWHYLSAYHAGGIIATVRYWVSNDFHWSKEELIKQLIKLDETFDSNF